MKGNPTLFYGVVTGEDKSAIGATRSIVQIKNTCEILIHLLMSFYLSFMKYLVVISHVWSFHKWSLKKKYRDNFLINLDLYSYLWLKVKLFSKPDKN